MNEFLINLDFYILGTDSLWADQSFYQFWWFIDWHGRVGGGVLAADIAILKLESGSRLIIMKTVWEMLLIDQFPPPRPALGLSPATTVDSGKMSAPKVSTRPGWGPGALHTCRVTAAWCIQLLSSNKHFSYPQLRRQSRQLICSLTPGPRDPRVIHNNHPPYTFFKQPFISRFLLWFSVMFMSDVIANNACGYNYSSGEL